MNADLENTLRELGPDYRELVGRLKAAYEPRVVAMPPKDRVRLGRASGWGVAYLAAASLMAMLAFGVFFFGGTFGRTGNARVFTVRTTTAANEYLLATIRSDEAVQEMIRTQRPDGSWNNDFLTRQNAAALRLCSSDAARIAYKKAMRNLRSRGAL